MRVNKESVNDNMNKENSYDPWMFVSYDRNGKGRYCRTTRTRNTSFPGSNRKGSNRRWGNGGKNNKSIDNTGEGGTSFVTPDKDGITSYTPAHKKKDVVVEISNTLGMKAKINDSSM
ncbi:hypothetical protein ACOSQ3_010342 [Xanthoceras sorbifolium]